ncbi:integrase/recombinase XerC [Tenacibaculum adriaticum]|uniref:Tyrosine recombinase XerC n=1 Tax=Tenacibaculum adriaticum TaxID=413713 RepID=A0A5S5DNR7_9FLAO|nr:tyrosine-type recombinase/integrase [Tenacibaculum adriaticum]TYP97521.1 integrase/recombinase XerC [Tenacibaculum adriaticum]
MLLTSFLEYLSYEKNYSQNTVTAYKTDLIAFRDFCVTEFKEEELATIHYNQIRSWIVSLVNQGISNRTINRKISSLKTFYKFLQKIGEVEVNPLAKHKALKVQKKSQIPFTKKEVNQVLESLDNENDFLSIRNKLIIELFYSTGMRRVELINIKEKDVDLHNKLIKVLGKRNKERYVPLLPSVVKTLSKYLQLKNNHFTKVEELLITEKGTKIYETLVYRTINLYFSQVSTKVKKSPHILRHTFATQMLNEGADLNSVKELLGHSSLASTQVYTHNSLEKMKQMFNKTHPRSKKND